MVLYEAGMEVNRKLYIFLSNCTEMVQGDHVWVGVGVGEVVEEDGWVHGLVEGLSAIYHRGSDLDGCLVEVLAGGFSALHGFTIGHTMHTTITMHPTI